MSQIESDDPVWANPVQARFWFSVLAWKKIAHICMIVSIFSFYFLSLVSWPKDYVFWETIQGKEKWGKGNYLLCSPEEEIWWNLQWRRKFKSTMFWCEFSSLFLILLLSTYCHELWPLFRLCKNCNADNSVPLKYLSKYCYIYFISLADNIGLHARLKFDRATTWQYFQKGVL